MVWLTADEGATPILVVGAGGIGCELLKNLILSGFTNLVVIDLDTIDVSNLNRQFLFRKDHVGKSKSLIAKESVLKLSHNGRPVTIDARHCSIFLPEFSVAWLKEKQFAFVLNALDNVKARNHVNRLCLAANIPLVESGTSGYVGEISIIRKGITGCYECVPKPRQKTFPGCTIRNTPTEPIHCIVWAKFLFGQLFGEADDEKQVSPDSADPELNQGNQEGNIQRINTTEWAEENDWDAKLLFDKFFNKDIGELLKMTKLWEKKGRVKPKPLIHNDLIGNGDALNTGQIMELRTMRENIAAWHKAVNDTKARRKEKGVLEWDKDDDDAMMFVAAAANIRCAIFNIEQKTEWKIKEMAGNIIPAIATSNAIIAGLIVLQAVRVLRRQLEKCKDVSLRKESVSNKLICPNAPDERNTNCVVCMDKPTVTIRCNTKKLTLGQFKEKVCQSTLSMLEPDCEYGADVILSSEEGDTTDAMLAKCLADYKIGHGAELVAEDFQQDFRVTIHVEHVDQLEKEYTDQGYQLLGTVEAPMPKEKETRKRTIESTDSPSDSPAKKMKRVDLADDDEDDLILC